MANHKGYYIMIDTDDTYIKTTGSKYRTLYRAYCDECGADRGYLTKQNASKPRCYKCGRLELSKTEVRQRMSVARKGKSPHNKGLKGVSKDTSNKMSAAASNRDPSTRDGHSKSLETRIKISNTLTGRSKFLGFKSSRYKRDLDSRLRAVLRSRLSSAIRGSTKSVSAVRDLGCTIEELKSHLESLFQPGMTWDNYGRSDESWNIDHIVPLSTLDLTDVNQLKQACHYTNLQPMWFKHNISKGNILIPKRDLSGKTVIIVCGPSGSGKTELCRRLSIQYCEYDKDRYSILDKDFDTISIIDTSVRANFFIQTIASMGARVISVYLKISRENILSNISARGGLYKSIDKRIRRYEYLENKGVFSFVGNFAESEAFIKKITPP